ncbi:MAG: hypothetical protein FWD29_04750 [Micrococcales bacterium]|nr:hypothetical protein [Micrococcales bacterium]
MATFTVRTDEAVDQTLGYLMELTGESRSQVVRNAVLEAGRIARREAQRAECLAARDDPVDRAEIQAAMADMGAGDAW